MSWEHGRVDYGHTKQRRLTFQSVHLRKHLSFLARCIFPTTEEEFHAKHFHTTLCSATCLSSPDYLVELRLVVVVQERGDYVEMKLFAKIKSRRKHSLPVRWQRDRISSWSSAILPYELGTVPTRLSLEDKLILFNFPLAVNVGKNPAMPVLCKSSIRYSEQRRVLDLTGLDCRKRNKDTVCSPMIVAY